MAKVLILSLNHYDIEDEETKKRTQLYQVWFVQPYQNSSDGTAFGYKPMKTLVSMDMFQQIGTSKLPALAEAEYDMRPGAGGKLAAAISGFKNIKPVDIFAGV